MIILIGTGYFFAYRALSKSSANEAHYALLEQQRAQQRAQAQAEATWPGACRGLATQPAVPGSLSFACPRASPETAWRTPREIIGPTSAAQIEDGRYDEMAVLTSMRRRRV